MKKLLIILLLFVSYNTYSQVDSLVTETQTERIIDKYGGKIVESFNRFADKALPIAEESFKIVVKLQIAKGIGYMFIPLITIIIIFTGFICAKKSKTLNVKKYESDRYEVIAVICMVLSIIGIIASCFCIYHGLLYLIAPEWFAIEEILNLF
jgi:galactitol-specific phosphotransferase system IIC component